MEEFKKGDYEKAAKKARKLLKDGVGIVEIINSTHLNIDTVNKLHNKMNKKSGNLI